MTENGDPLENAIAERVNGILKQKWLHQHEFTNIEQVRSILEPAIDFYKHNSCRVGHKQTSNLLKHFYIA